MRPQSRGWLLRHRLKLMNKSATHLKLYFGLALLIVLCAASTASAQQTFVTFSGRVTDQNTGQGIAGVAIAALGNQTGTRVVVTNAQGSYRLPFGSITSIKLRAYKTGHIFNPASSEFITFGGLPLTGTMTLNFTGALLPFQILILLASAR